MGRKNDKKRKSTKKTPTSELSSDDIWGFAEFFLDLAVKYETAPKTIKADPVHSLLLKNVKNLEPHLQKAYDRDYFERSIAKLTESLAVIYAAFSKKGLSREKAEQAIQMRLRFAKDALDSRKMNPAFLIPTLDQLKEVGGPVELAKINVSILLGKCPRTVHEIRKRAYRVGTPTFYRYILGKDIDRQLVLRRVFEMNSAQAEAICNLIDWCAISDQTREELLKKDERAEEDRRVDSNGERCTSAEEILLNLFKDCNFLGSRPAAQFADRVAQYMRAVRKNDPDDRPPKIPRLCYEI